MKGKIARYATRAAVLAAVLLTAGLFGSVANAQSNYQGTFTLSHEVQWGKAVIQPGTYLLTFPQDNQEFLVIRDAKSQKNVAFERISIREDSGTGVSSLLISARGNRWIVYSLRISELGETFVSDPALAHPRVVEEANNTRAVPVLMAKQ
jgi:hypothetical protein